MEQSGTMKELRILILEDTPSDAELAEHAMRKAGLSFVSKRVETREAFVRALEGFHPDIILSDYKLPYFDGMSALKLVQQDYPQVPVIMVTGALADIDAVELIRAGARDYVLKDRLARLPTAVRQVLSEAQDISARKQAENSLKLFRTLLDNSNDAIEVVDPVTLRLLDFNETECRVLGYSREELLTMSIPDIASGFDEGAYKALMAQLRQAGSARYERVHRRKDGSTFPVEISAKLTELDKPYLLCIVSDISERKQAEEKLYEAQQVFRALVENTPDIIARYDRDCRRTYVNPAYLKLAQMPEQELLASAPAQRSPLPAASAAALQDLLRRVLDNGVADDIDVIWPKADGIDYWYNSFAFPELDREGHVVSVMTVSRDITARKQMDEALRESEHRYRQLLDSVTDYIYTVQVQDGRPVATVHGPGCLAVTGYAPGDYAADAGLWFRMIHEPDRAAVIEQAAKALAGVAVPIEHRIIHRDGSVRWVRNTCVPHYDLQQQLIAYDGLIADITERKRMELALKDQKNFLSAILETEPECVKVVGADGTLLQMNQAGLSMLEANSVEEVNASGLANFVVAEDRAAFANMFRQVFAGETRALEFRVQGKLGTRRWLETRATPLTDFAGKITYLLGVTRDITNRKEAEEELKERDKHSQSLLRLSRRLEQSQTYTEVLNAARDEVGNIIGYQNLWVYLLTEDKKYAKALVAGGPTSDTVMSEEGAATLTIAGDRMLEEIAAAEEIVLVEDAQTDERVNREIVARLGNRTIVNIPITLFGRHLGSIGTGTFGDEGVRIPTKSEQKYLVALASHMAVTLDRIHLLTELRQGEQALEGANRALRTLSACNEALVRAENEAELLDTICRLIVVTGGYRMTWIGFPEQDAEKTVHPMARYGHEDGYLVETKRSWADNDIGHGPTGSAIRTGVVQVNQNFRSNPALMPWREAALKRGYQSSISLPFKTAAGTLGALTIYASEPDAFNETEISLLKELAGDLAFGIETLRTRAERDRIAIEQQNDQAILQRSLEQSIQAIADTVETRDPYTAGHQRRVAELATAIAREMGLDEQRIHGIRLAASIHDLGKIQVPAEILSKPGKLTEIDFMLIKLHAQSGYDILKDIEYPWPIADMVHQHHERLDGSGYPQGLKDGQILLESCILSVADVVEAMASHRPYRPAMGIDLALKEIERGRDSIYDPGVADACLKLFRERGYHLPV